MAKVICLKPGVQTNSKKKIPVPVTKDIHMRQLSSIRQGTICTHPLSLPFFKN